jgi:hypothetical protein
MTMSAPRDRLQSSAAVAGAAGGASLVRAASWRKASIIEAA